MVQSRAHRTMPLSVPLLERLPSLLLGDAGLIAGTVRTGDAREIAWHVGAIVLGAGLFGAAMGVWRSPMQALFTAVKFPLIVLLTTLGNALLNAMLAPLLGLNLSL